ncbi:MAG: hypothetical protein QGF94_00245 [Candidatus Thalassarchaeaceae archaeon]|jgi:hypothetical protein|nr:hypothetical protein [Candidatus Thalassarchaeaceae archaeon]
MGPQEQILVAALLAGLVAIAVTVAIEKFGGLIGGILGTIPTTIVPAAAFMWLAEPTDTAFQSAMGIVPVGMLLNAIFLWLWRVAPPHVPDWTFGKRLATITVINLSVWFTGAAIAVTLFSEQVSMTVGLTALLIGIILGLWITLEHQHAPRGHNKVGPLTLAMRGIAASTAIGLAVWLSQLGSPFVAGMASVFPAIFLTSMVALWIAQGEDVPSGAVGPMMLGAMSVSFYALLATYTLPEFGVVLGSAITWFASIAVISVPASFWLRLRANRRIEAENPAP